MTLTAGQHRQLARIDADLRRDDPHLARVLALPTPRIGRRGLAEVLGRLAVNVTGRAVLIVGAPLHQTSIMVAGLFLGAGGPVVSGAAFRLKDLRRARVVVSRRAAR